VSSDPNIISYDPPTRMALQLVSLRCWRAESPACNRILWSPRWFISLHFLWLSVLLFSFFFHIFVNATAQPASFFFIKRFGVLLTAAVMSSSRGYGSPGPAERGRVGWSFYNNTNKTSVCSARTCPAFVWISIQVIQFLYKTQLCMDHTSHTRKEELERKCHSVRIYLG
jgi:hypothetical protein